MNEVYRTVLGHFRHEVGHYYWDRPIDEAPPLEEFRQLFGDERADYGEALKRHYAQGAPPDWPQRYISAYASSHPWEDWAETWAHYLHILDTLQTAHAFGLRLDLLDASAPLSWRAAMQNPYQLADFKQIMIMWLPLIFALNSLNRSMASPTPSSSVRPWLASCPSSTAWRGVGPAWPRATGPAARPASLLLARRPTW